MKFKNRIHLLMVYILLIGCKPNSAVEQKTQPLQCLVSQTPCHLINEIGDFTFTFDVSEIKAEVPFTFYVTYHGKANIINVTGYLEGKNMFMGKVPLFFAQNKQSNDLKSQKIAPKAQVFSAESMVVACSEPVMEWNIWLTISVDNSSDENTKQTLLVNFASGH
jgi:hypothetical protein